MFYEEAEENAMGVDLDEEVQMLRQAWQTEVHCPEVLPFKRDLVESITQRISDQQAIIDERVRTPDEIFTAGLYQMDIDRVRYSLVRYLRARILKIEQTVDYIMSTMDVLDRLSSYEKTFASKLFNLNNTYMEEVYFNKLSKDGLREHISADNDGLRHSHPSLKDFVFCLAKKDLLNVDLGGNKLSSYYVNEVFVANYSAVREYVANESVQLI